MKKSVLIIMLLLAFTQCRESEKQHSGQTTVMQTQEELANTEIAKKIAMETQAALGGRLMEHLQNDGVLGAISYCNVNALPITDSISRLKGVQIQRITDKARNPANKASLKEIALMSQIRNSLGEGILPSEMRIVEDESVSFYVPIKTADLCLKCHGTMGKELNNDVAANIQSFYPEDKATGYSSNELRGLWKVTFNTKSNQ